MYSLDRAPTSGIQEVGADRETDESNMPIADRTAKGSLSRLLVV